MKSITVLGSTGSIGQQTLEVADHLGMAVMALTAYKNNELLQEQAREFNPDTTILGSDPGGMDAIIDVAENSGADIIVTAIAGEAGLAPTLAALKTGKRVALANKEPLVCAGDLVMQTAREYNTEIIPVDSEHSAIFQCILGDKHKNIKKLILTASGGPFRNKTQAELRDITPEQALKHPNWTMGKKVTIDSATMMNKGLEIIEAMHLFSVTPDQIEVIIHPQSIIHSMVEFTDGSIVAQLSNPDMRMPIQYALTYPDRLPGLTRPLDLTALKGLTFEKPNPDTFPCLALAYKAANAGTEACATLNRVNENAVELFLNNEIPFTDIPVMIEKALSEF
ncbi:MAG: 1-deoxy-D-xylulose-5-phosphate reductoisomerase [Oscillospiraceae bacterium]|nr:1-deoxy-D-xylulose-5-phosphate reductoisomerase [Oscillospiraceae bacterium]